MNRRTVRSWGEALRIFGAFLSALGLVAALVAGAITLVWGGAVWQVPAALAAVGVATNMVGCLVAVASFRSEASRRRARRRRRRVFGVAIRIVGVAMFVGGMGVVGFSFLLSVAWIFGAHVDIDWPAVAGWAAAALAGVALDLLGNVVQPTAHGDQFRRELRAAVGRTPRPSRDGYPPPCRHCGAVCNCHAAHCPHATGRTDRAGEAEAPEVSRAREARGVLIADLYRSGQIGVVAMDSDQLYDEIRRGLWRPVSHRCAEPISPGRVEVTATVAARHTAARDAYLARLAAARPGGAVPGGRRHPVTGEALPPDSGTQQWDHPTLAHTYQPPPDEEDPADEFRSGAVGPCIQCGQKIRLVVGEPFGHRRTCPRHPSQAAAKPEPETVPGRSAPAEGWCERCWRTVTVDGPAQDLEGTVWSHVVIDVEYGTEPGHAEDCDGTGCDGDGCPAPVPVEVRVQRICGPVRSAGPPPDAAEGETDVELDRDRHWADDE